MIADGARHSHAYPSELAELVLSNWNRVGVRPEVVGRPREGADAAPPFAVLRRLLSVCYQASLLHDEGRPTSFRVALGAPNSFASDAGPPKGLHRLLFTEPRAFDEQQLRRLAPAVKFQNALIGVNQDLEIWGLIHSGPGWLRFVSGGRGVRQFIPLVPIVAVTGPGRIQVAKGPLTIAHLLASLAEVDGAVVVTAALEVLGFGGEISALLPDASVVAHAIDLEGTELVSERADHAGMRHRSVYRLCQAMHECVAIVVSQDGGVRFIRWHERAVTYWDQIATGPWEL